MICLEQGDAAAQFNLGLMYYKGNGVIQDYTRAHMWWTIPELGGMLEVLGEQGEIEQMMTSAQ